MNKRELIAMLIAAFPKQNGDNMAALAGTYILALEGVEAGYVERSVKAFIQGKVPDHNKAFRPSPPAVAEYARAMQNTEQRVGAIAQHPALPEPDRAPQAEIDAAVERWQGIRESVLQADPVAVIIKSSVKSFDQKRRRWTDPDELQASAQRLRDRGMMNEEKPS